MAFLGQGAGSGSRVKGQGQGGGGYMVTAWPACLSITSVWAVRWSAVVPTVEPQVQMFATVSYRYVQAHFPGSVRFFEGPQCDFSMARRPACLPRSSRHRHGGMYTLSRHSHGETYTQGEALARETVRTCLPEWPRGVMSDPM